MKKTLLLAWAFATAASIAASIYFAATYPCESHPDARLREYYPATVVDKKQASNCSGRRCEDVNYLTMQLSDNSYKQVLVTSEAFKSAYIGGAMSFDRGVTDPVCISHDQKFRIAASVAVICLFAAFVGFITWVIW